MEHEITLVVNGATRRVRVPARRLLSDCLRHDLGLTGTHVGCEHGVCGCCTVLLDGRPIRSCLTFAVTVDGQEITTVEGLAREGAPSPGLRSARSAATGATREGGGFERPSRLHEVEAVNTREGGGSERPSRPHEVEAVNTREGGGSERPSRPHGVEAVNTELSPVQRAFAECHGLQCGFCTPGFLCTVTAFLRDNPAPSDDEIVEGISGNLCRCTGYQNIVKAVHRAAELLAEET
ncbi:(2Fe-2S)-binding protein [Nonomuraea sp. B1E8]|uniref:(2Fe-2S)-binding protein n=1 Tax=unclassified Nonomuraea TaxID=2593643 RepID=UPI00325D1340